MKRKKGVFIVLEGVEGTGKSTVCQFLETALKKEGYMVYRTREPGGQGSPVAEKIRALILDPHHKIWPETEALLFAASRAQHVRDVIKPHLLKGEIVLCDRFIDSSIAYQGYGRKLTAQAILEINRLAVGKCWPDLIIIFDLPPAIGLKRKRAARYSFDRLDKEKLAFHERVRKGYKILARQNPKRYRLVDVSKPLSEVESEVLDLIKKFLKRKMK